MSRSGWLVLACVIGCTVAPQQQAGPQPAQPTESYATVTTSDDPAPASEPAAMPDPFASAACPTDLSIAVGARKHDGRYQRDTIRARYTKEHLKPVTAAQMLSREDAIERVLGFEANKPGLIPAGFRAEIAAHGRDPSFRLYMARCELAGAETLRRAGHDAGLAYLLGAPADQVHALLKKSFYPDGPTSMSCTASNDCADGMFCDRAEKSCTSAKAKTASFLSAAELDVEDALVRGFASMLTPEMIENTRHDPDDMIGTFVYGRFVRCRSGTLCNFTRYSTTDGRTTLVNWDKRYRGESYGGASEDVLTGKAKECFDHTEASDLDQCVYRCGTGAKSKEEACKGKCYAWCE
jgi:hypothetical protein